MQPAPKNPGKGLGIAALVLGILGLLSIVGNAIVPSSAPASYDLAYTIGAAIGSSSPSIVGLILGIIGWRKSLAVKMSYGIALTGFILSALVVVPRLFGIIMILLTR
ncbi:MAG: hypothetical protein FWF91_07080 [Coriobacteriia bacterium]|nr:hypothetical protein [Coriobacteriia bacterium]